MRQPIIYVEDTTIEDKIVVIIFTLFIILTMVVFFSRYLVEEESKPISISQAQSDLFTNRTQLPEGLENQSLVTTGQDFIDPRNLTLNTLQELTGLDECPEGDCAIDLKTGVKRCPQNNNARIVYNRAFEGCSGKFFCTNDQLPYAVLSSGETDTFGVCEKDIECRCSADILCPKYVVSSFNLVNGSSFSGLRKDLNYYFDQTTLADDKIIGYDSIVIPAKSTSVQFCNINPSYIDRMAGGCQFVNGDNDILGCLTSQDFFQISETAFPNDISPAFPFSYQDYLPDKSSGNQYDTTQYQSSLNVNNVGSIIKPNKGYASFETPSGDLQILGYGKNEPNSKTINGTNISTVSNIVTTTYPSGGGELSTDLNTSQDISGKGNETVDVNTLLTFMNIIYTGCSEVSGVFISNNNMLICTQTANQPCKEGIFSYRVDDKPPEQFCQFSPTLAEFLSGDDNPSKTNGSQPPALNDSQFFTLSCVTGPGCNGDYSQSFCKNGDCTSAIIEYKSRFQDYDSAGVNGVWELKNSKIGEPGVITFTYNTSDGIVLKNNGLLKIEPGDYFATVRNKIQKLSIAEVTVSTTPGDEATFSLGSVVGLRVDMFVYVTGFKGSISSIDTSLNKIVVKTISSGVTKIPAYVLIDFFKPLGTTGDGTDFGRLIVREDGGIFPAKLSEQQSSPSQFADSGPSTIFIFKQFGFNGPNYNTKFVLETNPANGFSYEGIYRQYAELSQWYYWLNGITGVVSDGDLLKVPLSTDIIPMASFLDQKNKTITRADVDALTFTSPEADFKEDMSFYYPVWDQNKNNQTCIKCKPALYSYLKLDTDFHIRAAVIQFSGRDFGQYMYYPVIEQISNKFYFEITTPQTSSYIFNYLTSVSRNDTSTTKRIVLETIERNLPFSSDKDTPENYYADHPHYILDGNNILRRKVILINSSEFPVSGVVPVSVVLNQLQIDYDYNEINIPDDEWISFNFEGQELKPDNTVIFSLSPDNNSYINYVRKDNSNLFSGKRYYFNRMELIIQSQVRILNVDLVDGKQVIYTDATTSDVIPSIRNSKGDPTVVQIYSTSDTLELGFDQNMSDGTTTQTVIVDRVCDGRITNLFFPVTSNITKDKNALPMIQITKYRPLL